MRLVAPANVRIRPRGYVAKGRYGRMRNMTPMTKKLLDRVASRPQEDIEELDELAREIEARRTGLYTMTDDERAFVQGARGGRVVSDEEMAAFWKRYGIE